MFKIWVVSETRKVDGEYHSGLLAGVFMDRETAYEFAADRGSRVVTEYGSPAVDPTAIHLLGDALEKARKKLADIADLIDNIPDDHDIVERIAYVVYD